MEQTDLLRPRPPYFPGMVLDPSRSCDRSRPLPAHEGQDRGPGRHLAGSGHPGYEPSAFARRSSSRAPEAARPAGNPLLQRKEFTGACFVQERRNPNVPLAGTRPGTQEFCRQLNQDMEILRVFSGPVKGLLPSVSGFTREDVAFCAQPNRFTFVAGMTKVAPSRRSNVMAIVIPQLRVWIASTDSSPVAADSRRCAKRGWP